MREAVFNGRVRPFDVAVLAQALAETLDERGGRRRRGRAQVPNAGTRNRLRRGQERQGKQQQQRLASETDAWHAAIIARSVSYGSLAVLRACARPAYWCDILTPLWLLPRQTCFADPAGRNVSRSAETRYATRGSHGPWHHRWSRRRCPRNRGRCRRDVLQHQEYRRAAGAGFYGAYGDHRMACNLGFPSRRFSLAASLQPVALGAVRCGADMGYPLVQSAAAAD